MTPSASETDKASAFHQGKFIEERVINMDETKIFELLDLVRQTGKLKKGVNEATKAIERGLAKLVVAAKDVDPPELIMHLKPLCEEKKISYSEVSSKKELGRMIGINVGCAAIAVIDFGQASDNAKKLLSE